jgi:hypothetical protein
MAEKNAKKCAARKRPAKADIAIKRRFAGSRISPDLIAKGAIINAPPKFLQNTKVETGMVLFAMSGPDEPIPKIPATRNGISRPSGRAVCSWLFIFTS